MDGSQRERDVHYRAIDRPTENGREEETRDNREENSFLLAKKGDWGRQAKTISESMKRRNEDREQ